MSSLSIERPHRSPQGSHHLNCSLDGKLRDCWEEQPSPYHSLIDYLQEMQEKIDKVMPIIREHMEAAQREQGRTYNHPAQPREFQPGDKVLLLPDATCKFLARWQGPFTVLKRVGPIIYHLQQSDFSEHRKRGAHTGPEPGVG